MIKKPRKIEHRKPTYKKQNESSNQHYIKKVHLRKQQHVVIHGIASDPPTQKQHILYILLYILLIITLYGYFVLSCVYSYGN